MGFGKRFGASLCALLVFTQSARADEKAAEPSREPAAETASEIHAVTVPGVDKAGHPIEEKVPLQVTPLSELDKDTILPPVDAKELERVAFAFIRGRINEVKESSRSEKDKKLIIDVLEDLMRSGAAAFKAANPYTTVVNGIYFCGGIEVPLTAALIFQNAKVVKPSVSWAPVCIMIAGKEKSGTHGASGFIAGLGTWAGAQITKNTAADRAAGRDGDIEFQASGGVLVPLNGRSPNLKLGDLQGWYSGGGFELARPTYHRDRIGFVSGSITFLGKTDLENGIHFPDSGLIHVVVGRTGSTPFPFKAEALWLGTYVASDGSNFRVPTIPLTDISIGKKVPFTDYPISDSAESKHAADNRLKQFTREEVLDKIKKAQEEIQLQRK